MQVGFQNANSSLVIWVYHDLDALINYFTYNDVPLVVWKIKSIKTKQSCQK